jgi:hypothetical protein
MPELPAQKNHKGKKMKIRLFLFAVLFLGLSSPLLAHDLLLVHEHNGCDQTAAFPWEELPPGRTWQANVDLSQCTPEELGYFLFYGIENVNKRIKPIKVGSGLVLKVINMTTGKVSYLKNGKKNDPQRILSYLDQPSNILLTLENNGRKSTRIRVSWSKVSIAPAPE